MSIWVLQVCSLSIVHVCHFIIYLPSYAFSFFFLNFHGIRKILYVISWYLLHMGYMVYSLVTIYSDLYVFCFLLCPFGINKDTDGMTGNV